MDFFATENGEKSDSVNHIPNVLYCAASCAGGLEAPLGHPAGRSAARSAWNIFAFNYARLKKNIRLLRSELEAYKTFGM